MMWLWGYFTFSYTLSQQHDSIKSANKIETKTNQFLPQGKVICPSEPAPSQTAERVNNALVRNLRSSWELKSWSSQFTIK